MPAVRYIARGCFPACYGAVTASSQCECPCGGQNHGLVWAPRGDPAMVQRPDAGGRQLVGHQIMALAPAAEPPPQSQGLWAQGETALLDAQQNPEQPSRPFSDGGRGRLWDSHAPGSNSDGDGAGGGGGTPPGPPVMGVSDTDWDGLGDRARAVRDAQANKTGEEGLLMSSELDEDANKTLNPGVNDIAYLQLGDSGQGAFFKSRDGAHQAAARAYGTTPAEMTLSECAAWRMADSMGDRYRALVTPTVLREHEGQAGSLCAHRPGDTAGDLRNWRTSINQEQMMDGAFFDAVIGSQDRHGNNLLIDSQDNGRLTLIDHGYCFHSSGDYINASILVRERCRDPNAVPLRPHERQALQSLTASPDLHGIEPMIGRERANGVRRRALWMLDHNQIADVARMERM